MPLSVLSPSQTLGAADFVRLFHQTQQTWFGHLSDQTEVDFGRWLPALGFLLDAFLLPDVDAYQLMTSATELAQIDQTVWQSCSLNPSIHTERINLLIDGLTNSGWKFNPLEILLRRKKMAGQSIDIPDVMIIPARASYRHFTELMTERGNLHQALLHLDDGHLDALLALRDGRAIGCIEVLTSGDVGTLREWYVSPAYRGTGIGRLLMQRAMEVCDRAVLKHVMIGVELTADVARHLCETSGFVHVGQWLNYSSAV